MLFQVLEVLEFDKETPILIVLFRQEFRGTIPTNTLKWVMLHGKDGEHGKKIAHIIATTKEQHLVMRLLRLNNERLVPQPKRIDLERFFDASFILPVGPLGAKDVAKYNKNDGCSVCGDTAKNKCSRCNVTRYCSAGNLYLLHYSASSTHSSYSLSKGRLEVASSDVHLAEGSDMANDSLSLHG
jgi:hypothetical protein